MTQSDYGTIRNDDVSNRWQQNHSIMQKLTTGKLAKEGNHYFRKTPEKKSVRNSEFICNLCKNEYVDPRVLPCLHCFCVQCLQKLDLEQNPRTTTAKQSRNERFQGVLAGYFSKSSTTKNEYFRLSPITEGSTNGKDDFLHSRSLPRLRCPTCDFENVIPPQGVFELPPHYLLQHRMLIKSLNRGEICLLCDLCPSEIPAASRCTKCLLNLCSHCSKAHKREKLFPDHELKKLQKNHENGVGITRIRRQAMCHAHPEKELKLYCSSCNQVTCTECRVQFHSGHDCESSSRAAQMYTCRIRKSLERTHSLNKDTSATINRLNVLSQQIEETTRIIWKVEYQPTSLLPKVLVDELAHTNACEAELQSTFSQVQNDINCHIDCYVEVLEDHRKSLLKQATHIRNTQIQSLKSRKKEIEKKAKDIRHIVQFGEELLTEGSDFEVLSFAYYVLQRLEWCIKSGSNALSSALTSCIGSLQFLPDERAGTIKNYPLYGVVTTQVVAPSHCYITPEGVNNLRNCRENERCVLTLVTTDNNDQRLTHGAEGIEVELKPKNRQQRQIPIFIVDLQNGLYDICFTPEVPGKMCLSVSIRGVPIKGSPFTVFVRAQKNHKGVFHCCTFCSSGGNKNAVCGCGGRMPGGYRGCGHGYTGHPGQRHWSCCGNTLQKSECFRSFRKDGFYQLSL